MTTNQVRFLVALMAAFFVTPCSASFASYTAGTVSLVADGNITDGVSQTASITSGSDSISNTGTSNSGTSTVSVTALDQSVNGFAVSGTISGSSTPSTRASSQVSNRPLYDFTVTVPTWISLQAGITRTNSDPGIANNFAASMCSISGCSAAYALTTGTLGGAGYTGGNYAQSELIPAGSYTLAFGAIDETSGASSPQSFTDTFHVTLSIVPIPAAGWLFGSGLFVLIGFARRKAV